MDLEGIPGLSKELNSEVANVDEAFCGHQDSEPDMEDDPDEHSERPIQSRSDDLDRSVEDRDEEALVHGFFEEPCCMLGPNNNACWNHAGRQRLLKARQECQDLEKKELDLAVLATLRVSRSVTDLSERSSINYQFEGKPIFKTAFLFDYGIGAKHLKNLVSHYNQNGMSVRVHKNTRNRPRNRTEINAVEKIKGFIENFA